MSGRARVDVSAFRRAAARLSGAADPFRGVLEAEAALRLLEPSLPLLDAAPFGALSAVPPPAAPEPASDRAARRAPRAEPPPPPRSIPPRDPGSVFPFRPASPGAVPSELAEWVDRVRASAGPSTSAGPRTPAPDAGRSSDGVRGERRTDAPESPSATTGDDGEAFRDVAARLAATPRKEEREVESPVREERSAPVFSLRRPERSASGERNGAAVDSDRTARSTDLGRSPTSNVERSTAPSPEIRDGGRTASADRSIDVERDPGSGMRLMEELARSVLAARPATLAAAPVATSIAPSSAFPDAGGFSAAARNGSQSNSPIAHPAVSPSYDFATAEDRGRAPRSVAEVTAAIHGERAAGDHPLAGIAEGDLLPGAALEADALASLVNDALVEQARRHGVDLS